MKPTRLIVLRGPSAAGKTTAAKSLFAAAPDHTVLLEQDQYRALFKPPGGDPGVQTLQRIIVHNTLTALRDGYDVILEGILNRRAYADALATLFAEHPARNHLFYFDVSLEETLRRHAARHSANLSTEQDMRGWYRDKDVLGYDFERVIPESSSPAQTLATIRRTVGW